VLRGTGIRVQTIAVASTEWGLSAAEIATEYELSVKQVEEALAFFNAHWPEIEAHMAYEARLAVEAHG
jgi:uncharacterized protein (DUF433 family)